MTTLADDAATDVAHDEPTEWAAYLRAVTPPGVRQIDICAKTGLHQSTISRWFSGAIASPEFGQARDFAVAYDLNLLEVFVRGGLLTPAEAETIGPLPSVDPRLLTDEQLAAEFTRRLAETEH